MKKPNEEPEKTDSISIEQLKYCTVHLPYDRDKNSIVKVPRFLVNAFKFLHERHYLEIEGIYRKQGNSSKITSLEACFLNGEFGNDDLSVYDVCVLIKRFIKSIKGGLFGTKEERIVDAAFDQHGNETPRTLCHFCHTLPSCNYGILCYIIFQLSRVVRHSTANKMDAENLAIVFVPAMFKSFDRKIALDSKNISGIKERQETLKATVVMLIKHVTELIVPQTFVLRNNSMNRSQNSQPIHTVISTGRTTPQRSASVVTSNKSIVVPKYSHAAAPNVVSSRSRGSAAGLVAEKTKEKTFLRAARRRSKSLLRNVINFASKNEQYSVNEQDGAAELKPSKSHSRRSKLIRRNTSS